MLCDMHCTHSALAEYRDIVPMVPLLNIETVPILSCSLIRFILTWAAVTPKLTIIRRVITSFVKNPKKLCRGSALPSKKKTKEMFRNADAVCFDVDSTVICDEGLDQLASYCDKAQQVRKITEEAMKGGMEFRDALRLRLNIIRPSLNTVRNFIKENPPLLTEDIATLVNLLQERNVDIYLVSGGFRSLIAPVAKLLQIPFENLYANRLKFYFDGSYAGFDESQPTSRSGGKAEVIRILKEKHGYSSVVMVGDGATDMEACPPADAFIGFGGNVVRESVKGEATWFVMDFGTLVDELNDVEY